MNPENPVDFMYMLGIAAVAIWLLRVVTDQPDELQANPEYNDKD